MEEDKIGGRIENFVYLCNFYFSFFFGNDIDLFYSSAFNNPFLSVARSTKVFQHEGNFHRDILVDEMAVTN